MDIWGLILYLLNLLFAFLQALIRSPMPPGPTSPAQNVTTPPPNCPPGFLGQSCEIECGLTNVEQNLKIVGGVDANPNSWPAQAFITACLGTSPCNFCGGTLIDPQTVLSAAHCAPNSTYVYTVYLGLNDNSPIFKGTPLPPTVVSFVIPFSNIVRHMNYNATSVENDIALFKLGAPGVNLTNQIQVACLPQSPSNTYPNVNQTSWIVGWGATSEGGSSPDLLKNARITIYDGNTNCAKYNIMNWDKQICAGEFNGGTDTCQGDSGGPLYVLDTVGNKTKYVTTGVVSYGQGCARNETAGIYTRISAYLDWIKANK